MVHTAQASVTRWYDLCRAMLSEQSHGVWPQLMMGQLLAQIDLESGGGTDAISNTGAVGLMQIIPDVLRGGPEWLRSRPTREPLMDPRVNLSFGVYMMNDAMRRAHDRKMASPWESALVEYYTGDMRGWDLEFGGVSGRGYIAAVKERLPAYTDYATEQSLKRVNKLSLEQRQRTLIKRLFDLLEEEKAMEDEDCDSSTE